jgi:hypothetical protein
MSEDENEILVKDSINLLISDFQKWGINNFGDWLLRYDDTIEQVLGFVETYLDKVERDDLDAIEGWEAVVMLNPLALYMVELDINFVPEGDLRYQIQYIFVETIREYISVKKGLSKVDGKILISNAKNYEFIKQ